MVALLLAISMVLLACTVEGPPAARTYRNASIEELAALQERGDTVLLVNTHTPYEGHIEGTDAYWMFDAISQEALPKDMSTPIVVYCRSGRMSAIAAQSLADAGYTNVTNIEGGMIAWERSGRSVVQERSDECETTVCTR